MIKILVISQTPHLLHVIPFPESSFEENIEVMLKKQIAPHRDTDNKRKPVV